MSGSFVAPIARRSRLVLLGSLMGSLIALVQGCGGDAASSGSTSGGSGGSTGGGGGTPSPAPAPTEAQRIAAATSTATSTSNGCAAIQPFYWEVGDKTAAKAGGSVDPGGASAATYAATTSMDIESASAWLYAAYVLQKTSGELGLSDIKYFTQQSGYSAFTACLPSQSVAECAGYQQNGTHDASTDSRFHFGPGHLQAHATSAMGLGSNATGPLAAEMQSQLGADIGLSYSLPQLANGAATTPADYARFLRKVLDGTLVVGPSLGTSRVCTNPATCATARSSPLPSTMSWHYSIGHWVEDDANGDGSFSNVGAYGFYPWINKTKTVYGLVARQSAATGAGVQSASCGALIRKAWTTGTAQ